MEGHQPDRLVGVHEEEAAAGVGRPVDAVPVGGFNQTVPEKGYISFNNSRNKCLSFMAIIPSALDLSLMLLRILSREASEVMHTLLESVTSL